MQHQKVVRIVEMISSKRANKYLSLGWTYLNDYVTREDSDDGYPPRQQVNYVLAWIPENTDSKSMKPIYPNDDTEKWWQEREMLEEDGLI